MSGSAFPPGEEAFLLASASQARASLLLAAGVELQLCPSDIVEDALKRRLLDLGHGGVTVALRLAQEKALDVSFRRRKALVLGADQTLVVGPRLFSKAQNRSEAIRVLTALSGRDHVLHAAFAFAWRGRLVASGFESATLRIRHLCAGEIAQYLDAVGPNVYQSVGCYQVEALGRGLFDKIEGDHSTILGLPMTPVLSFLRKWNNRRSAAPC